MRDPSLSVAPTGFSPYWERLKDFTFFILILWIIEAVDQFLLGNSLENHGIHPRSFSHLEGFLFAPLLHAGWAHLFGNSVSLIVLGAAILAFGWRELATVSIAAALGGGLVAWLIGTNGSNHIGASCLVFGYLAFLLALGFYQRTPATILFSLLIIFFYGGAFFGILPGKEGISWESHLGGAIGGFLVARSKRKKLAS
ncbi:MAG: rhomboid family intramembrane serine protease [Akkermansiaceae bacterium]|jgi:membrane associated rhomboid family serine protease